MILTTGTKSGLGRYIYENLGGTGLTRSNFSEEIEKCKQKGVDIIIHCAFNSGKGIDSLSLHSYLSDNVFLTKTLTAVPHKKFVFISTVDVYPKMSGQRFEEEIIEADSLDGLYPITKLMAESMVMNCCENYLILRPTAFLGKYSRPNSLIRIIEEENCVLTLSADSKFNYILHSDVLKFIEFAITNDLKGIYNIASSENVRLSDTAEMLGKRVKFGSHKYDVGNISNSKIASLFSDFKKTSKEVIAQFLMER